MTNILTPENNADVNAANDSINELQKSMDARRLLQVLLARAALITNALDLSKAVDVEVLSNWWIAAGLNAMNPDPDCAPKVTHYHEDGSPKINH